MDGTEKLNITNNQITYEDDRYGRKLQIVMDRGETPIMKKFANVVTQNGGDILEIGFGLGISADFIYNSNIRSYTCIEIHPEIYKKALEWAKDKDNVEILLGNWRDVMPTLTKKFDGIFFDTYENFNNVKNFNEYCIRVAKENCVLSLFNPEYIHKTCSSCNVDYITHDVTDYLGMRKNHIAIVYAFYNDGEFKGKPNPEKII